MKKENNAAKDFRNEAKSTKKQFSERLQILLFLNGMKYILLKKIYICKTKIK